MVDLNCTHTLTYLQPSPLDLSLILQRLTHCLAINMGTRRKHRGFLALPGEIRNRIYAYYFASTSHCEIASQGSTFQPPTPLTVKLYANQLPPIHTTNPTTKSSAISSPPTLRISRPLGKHTAIQALRTNWRTSLHALHLICKLIHKETIPFLYRNTVFKFNAPKRLKDFLNIISPHNLAHITRLQLHYDTYGSPRWAADVIWQEKHGRSW
jgi:hypothetical protein